MNQYKSIEDLLIKNLKKYQKTVRTLVYGRFFVFSLGLLFLTAIISSGCSKRKELINQPLYEGPMLTMDSVYTVMSDSAELVMTLTATKQNNYENGDQEWPESFYLEYMDETGAITSTFRADYVYYTERDELYKAEGNVVVKNMENGDELNTEELYWSPRKEIFYTERFVTIQADDEVHTGEGLEANQDFTSYKILKPQGTLLLEDQ